jgi:hypothetical protein
VATTRKKNISSGVQTPILGSDENVDLHQILPYLLSIISDSASSLVSKEIREQPSLKSWQLIQ